MNDKINVDDFYKAVLSLKNREECEEFFTDVCTDKEILTLAQRFTVAKMIMRKLPYTEIVSATGVSTATISRVNRVLKHGTGLLNECVERVKKL